MNNTVTKYESIKSIHRPNERCFFSCILILILSYFLLLEIKADSFNLVFSDQVDLFAGYYADPNFLSLFMQQHGPHRQGLGALLMYPVLKISQWNLTYLSYLTLLLMTLSSIFFSVAMLRRTITLVNLSVVGLVLSFGSLELITVTPNISHSVLPIFYTSVIVFISIQFGTLSHKHNYIVLALSILSLFTGFGIILFITYLAIDLIGYFFDKVILHKKINLNYFFLKYFFIVLAISTFFYDYNFSKADAEGCSPSALTNLWSVLEYSFAVASNPLGGAWFGKYSILVGFFTVMLYSVVGVKAAYSYFMESDGLSYAVIFLILGSLFFILNASIGRHCLGIDSAFASRYFLFSSLGLIGVLISSAFWKGKLFLGFYTTLAIFVFITQATIVYMQPLKMSQYFFNQKRNFVECVESGLSVSDCNAIYSIYPPDSSKLNDLLIKFNQIK